MTEDPSSIFFLDCENFIVLSSELSTEVQPRISIIGEINRDDCSPMPVDPDPFSFVVRKDP